MELELRLTILAIGLIIIILIYLWGIRHRIRETWEERHRRRQNRAYNEPVMESVEETYTDHHPANSFEASTSNEIAANPAEALADKADSIITADRNQIPGADYDEFDEDIETGEEAPNILLFIAAPKDAPFQGSMIKTTLQAMELKLNSKGTWSFYINAEMMTNPVFRVGHLKEPGVFDMQTIDTLETPGLVLFIQLPGPLEALAAIDRMIESAGELAEKLGGSVCDDHGHKMTPQLISHLRAQATEYDRRMRLRN